MGPGQPKICLKLFLPTLPQSLLPAWYTKSGETAATIDL
jgi:hypothetical protein